MSVGYVQGHYPLVFYFQKPFIELINTTQVMYNHENTINGSPPFATVCLHQTHGTFSLAMHIGQTKMHKTNKEDGIDLWE